MRKFLRKTCRVLFSRYAISAAMIVFEVLFITMLLIGNFYTHVTYLIGFSLVFSLIILFIIINRDVNPEYKVSWIFIVLVVQPIGGILYLLFLLLSLVLFLALFFYFRFFQQVYLQALIEELKVQELQFDL